MRLMSAGTYATWEAAEKAGLAIKKEQDPSGRGV
jgi:hypothetical protein